MAVCDLATRLKIRFMNDPGDEDAAWQAVAEEAKRHFSPDPPADTARVRIAVAANVTGDVGACSICRACDESTAMFDARAQVSGPIFHGIVEADIPRIPVVQGRTVETK